MARRKSSFLEDVIELGMKLPWWISVIAAVLLYFLFHYYSQITIAPVTGPGAVGSQLLLTIIKTVARYAQYVIPGLLILGMAIMLIKNFIRRLNFIRVIANKAGDKLDRLTWIQFEDLVHQYFLERGFAVSATQRGPDGGVDLRLKKDGRTTTVQCKHWRARKVGVSVVREQYGIMTAENADRCFVVTSGEFTAEAKAWADDNCIELIDGEQLRYLLGRIADDYMQPNNNKNVVSAAMTGCPRCGAEMVLRKARRGKNAGSRFWGCSTFPKCRGTRVLG